ncbi:hypothetical protein, partial [Helicobacter kayseriensis]|uniref:hypothetical protein n=1 Tax=Helicobacter kayseriensis TaxID=2905877 RepID=UPI001E53557E
MNENKFEILTSAHSITTKLQDLLKQECITKIEIYCSDFADYEKMHKLSKNKGKLRPLSARIYKTLIDFVNHDHNDLPKDIIQVYSNRSFLQENLMDLINHQKDTKKYLGEKKGWFVSQKGILTQDQENIQTMLADYLRPIAQQARDNISQYRKNLKLSTPSCSILGAQCAQDEFVTKNRDFSSLSELTKYFLDYSQNPKEDLAFLTNQLSSFQQKLTKILQHILDAEGIQKDIAPSLEEGFSHFLNHLQSVYDDGNMPYIKITITFLIQVIPALIDLAVTRGLSTSWIDLATSIYDFSKKMWNLSDYQYAYTYMLPLYELFVQDIAPAFGLLGQKNLNNIIYIHTKNQTHFIDYSHYNPFMFELNLFSHFGYALYGSSHHLKTRYSSSSFSLEILNQDNIQKHLQKMFAQLHPRISFFSSPYFNSHKLIQWIKEQENNQKIQANYLILSQCPTKSNAGLSESLIQKLGYEIKDEINRTPQSPKLAQKPQDTYSPEVDYSKYEIKIDAKDNAPFVLSLSPFGFIPKETYQTLLQNKSVKAPSDSMFGGSIPIDQAKLSALDYLESFFQSQEQIQETIQKEQEIFEKEVKLMQAFLSSLGSLQSSGLFYTYEYQTHE